MRHRSGQNRLQFGRFATPLDDMIAPENMVRVVDAFVDAIDLEKLGFVHVRAHVLIISNLSCRAKRDIWRMVNSHRKSN